MELATLIASIIAALVTAVADALRKGDLSVLDRPVKDILPLELKITLARKRAEIDAAAKFGDAPTQRSKVLGVDVPPENPYDPSSEG